MADLDAKRQAVLQGIAELSQEKVATLEQIQALRVKTQAVQEAAEQLDAEQAAKIPQAKSVMSFACKWVSHTVRCLLAGTRSAYMQA